ncbi:MFS transporter, DHA1 family, bicyclomycin/chloramphenicol resistance protein [Amphritea atlantica]|uniref:MFS transporter, DHA1 family, bicyclomycin/chloramphenicol resistance protein n=1 Tax=Amphritea atlantica TaxID=355243 RepID=A0A1H9FWY8_9GAMM|nr:multidrug effflux MFS transporter [Amphritea atlantica]SEQ42412.1 MFS transporter, DHA1 family, bicyclomycin/chloramphenicol resistance protein [Amphritea atlantica]
MPTSSNTQTVQIKTPVALLAGMAIASPVALNLYAPVMPVLAEQFNTTPFIIQLGYTFYLLTLAIGQLISGPLADRYGRRPVFFWGFLLHIIGGLIGIFAFEAWHLLLARILQAAGGCTGMLLARSIILDQHGKDKAAGMLGYITMGIATAQAVAPTMGGYLNLAVGWQSVFWVSMVLGSIVWLGALLRLPETAGHQKGSGTLLSSFSRYKTVLSSRSYIYCALSATMAACGFFVFMNSSPFIVDAILMGNSADYGNWFLMVAGGFWLGSLVAGKISATIGTRKMMLYGCALSAGGAVLMLALFNLFPLSFAALFLPMALFTFGRGLIQPNAQAAAVSSTTGAVATATGMLGFMQLTIGSLVAQITPLLIAISIYMLPTVLLFLALMASFFAIKGSQGEQHH